MPLKGVLPGAKRAQRQKEFTIGDWATEVESALAFDAAVPTDLFRIYREVRGTLVQPRPGQVDRAMRIDRVLVPRDALLDLGWKYGIVGVELKRSGEKIGPPIAQAMDYSRGVWTLPGDMRVWLEYVFVWPMAKQGSTIGSICAQQRVGSCGALAQWSHFYLKSGETSLLDISDGRVRVGAVESGAKVGSR